MILIRAAFVGLLAMCVGVSSVGAQTPPVVAGVSTVNGVLSFSSPTALVVSGAFHTTAEVDIDGRTVTVPATAQIAANAAQFAISAVRANSAGLMVSLTASWLLNKGLTC